MRLGAVPLRHLKFGKNLPRVRHGVILSKTETSGMPRSDEPETRRARLEPAACRHFLSPLLLVILHRAASLATT